jgi:hypothetical protein
MATQAEARVGGGPCADGFLERSLGLRGRWRLGRLREFHSKLCVNLFHFFWWGAPTTLRFDRTRVASSLIPASAADSECTRGARGRSWGDETADLRAPRTDIDRKQLNIRRRQPEMGSGYAAGGIS